MRLLLAIAAVAGGFCPAPRVRSTRSPVAGYRPAPRVHGVGPRRRLLASELSELVSPEAIAAFASARGPVAYGAAHSAAIVLCLPITPLLELGAGFCFGAPAGIATVWAAKSVASVATYGIASVARPARLAAATEKVLMEQPRLRAIADDVQARGKEFTLLARLSPVPSWANNYGLALAGVEFEDYLPASVGAVLPALVAHVLVGSSLAELSTSRGDSSPALLALSAASALVLVQRLATAPERVK